MTPPHAPASATGSRLDRRKARTRSALIGAAVTLIADGRGDRASVQEITETADVGFGSFYNHFESKDELFRIASQQLLERWGQMIDLACEGITDPAEVFSVSFRVSGRLGSTQPVLARFLVGAGLALLDADLGLGPRALRDIRRGQDAGRFTVPDAGVALAAAAGALFGLLRRQGSGEPGSGVVVAADVVDDTTAAVLRLLGVPADDAARLVALPLPDVTTSATS